MEGKKKGGSKRTIAIRNGNIGEAQRKGNMEKDGKNV